MAFFTFLKDMVLPVHAHGAQWGTVVEGEIEFTIGGRTQLYRAGDSYFIPSGVEHGAVIKAGTRVVNVFEEADRYAFSRRSGFASIRQFIVRVTRGRLQLPRLRTAGLAGKEGRILVYHSSSVATPPVTAKQAGEGKHGSSF